MSIPYETIIARMQPQKQLLLPYLIARTSVSNLVLNEEFSLVVVFGLLPILFLMSYDQINQESGGVFESPSQGQELRDRQQVYRQKTKTKPAENEENEFELLLRLQRQDINFVKMLASLSKSVLRIFSK